MTLDEAIQTLRSAQSEVPAPLRLPTADEVADAERRLGRRLHPDFRRYLLQASDVAYGSIEPVTITDPEAHTDLFKVAHDAWDQWNVPRDLLPICEDNANFYCMNATGEIHYWAHDGATDEHWPDLAAWIEEVWLVSE